MRVWKKMRLRMRSLFDRVPRSRSSMPNSSFTFKCKSRRTGQRGCRTKKPATPPFASLEPLLNSQRSAGTCEV